MKWRWGGAGVAAAAAVAAGLKRAFAHGSGAAESSTHRPRQSLFRVFLGGFLRCSQGLPIGSLRWRHRQWSFFRRKQLRRRRARCAAGSGKVGGWGRRFRFVVAAAVPVRIRHFIDLFLCAHTQHSSITVIVSNSTPFHICKRRQARTTNFQQFCFTFHECSEEHLFEW